MNNGELLYMESLLWKRMSKYKKETANRSELRVHQQYTVKSLLKKHRYYVKLVYSLY